MAVSTGRIVGVISASICLLALVIHPGFGHSGGYGGGHGGGFGHGLFGLSHLGLLATNLSVLCTLKGGTCTLPGSCITNLHSGLGIGGGYGGRGFNQFLCNTTTICCQPFKVFTFKKTIYPSSRRKGRRRSYGRSRGYGRSRKSSRRRGYGRSG